MSGFQTPGFQRPGFQAAKVVPVPVPVPSGGSGGGETTFYRRAPRRPSDSYLSIVAELDADLAEVLALNEGMAA